MAFHIIGVEFHRGDILGISISELHRDERYWIEPSEFRPERFLEDEVRFLFVGIFCKYVQHEHAPLCTSLFNIFVGLLNYPIDCDETWQSFYCSIPGAHSVGDQRETK